jgi:hypothetical protein
VRSVCHGRAIPARLQGLAALRDLAWRARRDEQADEQLPDAATQELERDRHARAKWILNLSSGATLEELADLIRSRLRPVA